MKLGSNKKQSHQPTPKGGHFFYLTLYFPFDKLLPLGILHQRMKSYLLLLLMLFVAVGLMAQDSLDKTSFIRFEGLPQRMVPTFTADARSHRLMLQKSTKELAFFGSMGGYFPMFNATIWGKTIQFSAGASTHLTLKRYVRRGEVLNVDFFADFLADLQMNKNWYLRTGFGHTSQHIADDAIVIGIPVKNYVKDYVQLQTMHKLFKQKMLLYGGFYYLHNFKIGENNSARDLSRKVMLQIGTEVDVYRITSTVVTYVAADVKFRQEFDFATTHALQAGFKIKPKQNKTIRLAYNYLGGYEERGFLYNTKCNLHTIGLYFDF